MKTPEALRVALFTDADVYAGTETHMLELAGGLNALGEQVVIACPRPSALSEKADARGLPTIVIQKGGFFDLKAILTLRRLLRTRRFDIIHAHNGRTAASAAVAVFLARRGRLVITQHFLEPGHISHQGPKANLYRLAHQLLSRQASAVIAVSQAVRESVLSRGEAPAGKISVVPNGISAVDMEERVPASEIRKSLGVEPDQCLVICVGRLESEKDVATLIAAMKTVALQHPTAVCAVAGEGAERETLARQVDELGLSGAVRFLGYRRDVPALINAADVFVLPSLFESFGLVLIEAMAMGKPVVATRCGGPEEIVVEGETGLLVPRSDPPAMAEAINRLLADPALREVMGQKGKARFQLCYTAGPMAAATLEIYRTAVEAG